MQKSTFTLTKKIQLTVDVWELIFECEDKKDFIPGQFITFFIDGMGARAYSILEKDINTYSFIIKALTKENSGRGGSEYICNLGIWDTLEWLGPVGRFVLEKNDSTKMFLWTGTGFAPLWNQIIHTLEDNTAPVVFIFWVRNLADVFYKSELDALKKKYPHFNYSYYLSAWEEFWFTNGRITQFITQENIENYQDFYICGSPAMVDDVKELLEALWKKNIYLEKY